MKRWIYGSTPIRFPEASGNAVSWNWIQVIHTDDEMLLAQQCVANLRTVLMEARKAHSPRDYTQLAEPILFEIQQREQEILEYLSGSAEQKVAS